MSFSPKWYYTKKTIHLKLFKTLTLIYQKGRHLKKTNSNLLNSMAQKDYIKIIAEFENIFEAYELLNQEQLKTLSKIKKIKRSPYKTILLLKHRLLSNLNNKRFQQLIFVLKEMLYFSFTKQSVTNIPASVGLELVGVYNICSSAINAQVHGFNPNICSNTYPNLLLPQSSLKFDAVLQLLSQSRIEMNILEVLLELFNMSDDAYVLKTHSDCSPSSLEVLNILTQHIQGEDGNLGEFITTSNSNFIDDHLNGPADGFVVDATLRGHKEQLSLDKENVFNILYTESIDMMNLLLDCPKIVPLVTDKKQNSKFLLSDVLKTVWTHISTILDHFILWWKDTPMSCYSVLFVDSIRNGIFSDNLKKFQEPVYSSLKALCEVLTIYVSNNLWDKMFRITLVKSSYSKRVCKNRKSDVHDTEKGLYVGEFWNGLFNNLKVCNNFLLSTEGPTCQMAVAEQIPILHRLDHSIHSMRLWVNEQCKYKSSQWVIEAVFQLFTNDVQNCLETLSLVDSQKLSLENVDILMTVCISLRAKLLVEISVNVSKLKSTSEGCISVLSAVCRNLCLANFSLSFPSRHHWQQNVVKERKNAYVSFVLDQIFVPALNATKDITILELILKLICEAWIDYIYSQRVKFSEAGALALLNDFDTVKDWISNQPDISEVNIKKLVDHEVLHMCKGVGKVLVRKPNEMIAILHSPKHRKPAPEELSQETHLPSEMFVPNQSTWLQLRASSRNFPISMCCSSASLALDSVSCNIP